MEKVTLTRENGISIVSFQRPEKFNALNIETLKQLYETMQQVEDNDDPIVILTGAGKAFSAGGDIEMMQQMDSLDLFEELIDVVNDLAIKQYLMGKIVISAVNGSAAGLGLSIALNADYVVGNKDAKFGMLFGGVGLIPDGGGHFYLKERIGKTKSKQFIWSLEQVAGDKAHEMGLVDVLTDGDALEAAKALAQRLLTGPILAITETKMIYHEQTIEDLRYYLEREKEGQMKLRQTEDHREGIDAFLSKRKANFQGK